MTCVVPELNSEQAPDAVGRTNQCLVAYGRKAQPDRTCDERLGQESGGDRREPQEGASGNQGIVRSLLLEHRVTPPPAQHNTHHPPTHPRGPLGCSPGGHLEAAGGQDRKLLGKQAGGEAPRLPPGAPGSGRSGPPETFRTRRFSVPALLLETFRPGTTSPRTGGADQSRPGVAVAPPTR